MASYFDPMIGKNVTDLPLFSCHFVELPDSRVDCSLSNPNICVKCPILGRFITGGGLDEFGSTGHVVSLVQWVFTMFIGIFGTFTNCLIITIMRRQNSGRAFDLLLIALASFDLIGSFSSVVASTSTVAIFENWDRGLVAQYLVYFGTFTAFFARSGSSFMTVLITAERYLVIAFPIRSSTWFTSSKTKLFIVFIYVFAAFMAMPRFASFFIVSNDIGKDIPSIQELDYIILATFMEPFWYRTTGGFFDKIDFWVPLPLLLLLNVLVYWEIRKFAKKRKQMNMKLQKDIRAAKMFVPVVIILFLCNVEPYVHYYYIAVEAMVYREHFLGVFLSVAVNSAVNLPIYYFKGGSFRNEVRGLFSTCLCAVLCKKGKGRREGTTTLEKSTGVSALTASHSDNNEWNNKRGKWEPSAQKV